MDYRVRSRAVEETVSEKAMSAEEIRRELDFLLASDRFLRSDRLRVLFGYICGKYLEDKKDEVTEYRMAVDVFRRRPETWSSEDSIVRVQVHELRKRLRMYYAGEGRDRPWRVEIPRGSYWPEWTPAQPEQMMPAAEGEGAHCEAPTQDPSLAGGKRIWLHLTLVCLGGSILLNSFLLLPRRTGGAWTGAVDKQARNYVELFGPEPRKGGETLFCLSNPSVVMVRGTDEPFPQEFTRDEYLPMPRALTQLLRLGPTQRYLYAHPTTDEYTGMGEAVCAYRLGRLLERVNVRAKLTQTRFLNWDRVTQDNLILLGLPQNSDRWTRNNVGSRLFWNSSDGIGLKGQEKPYNRTFDPRTGRIVADYGVISREVTPSGSWILVLAANSSFGTHGLGDFLADPQKMNPVFQKLRASTKDHALPRNFVLLFRAEVRENVPTEVSLVALRVADPS